MNRIRDFLYLHLTREPLRVDGYGMELAIADRRAEGRRPVSRQTHTEGRETPHV